MEKQKMTKEEKSWILYDVANSAFIMTLTATIPIYFRALATEADISATHATSIWGTCTSIAILILALLSPILGALADYQNMKKRIFVIFLAIGIGGGIAFTIAPNWITFLLFFIVSRIGYTACNVFYDAMLVDVTTDERMDQISSFGYAFGYIGSCIPFILSLVLVLMYEKIGITMHMAMTGAFFLNAVWWAVVTIPLLRNYRQKNYVAVPSHSVKNSFKRLGQTFMDVHKEKKIFWYLLAFFFFIDGVYTIIEMATAYGSALGLDSTGLLLALLVTQIVAFPCALICAKLSGKYPTERLIGVCIVAYIGIALFAIQLDKQWEFWTLAVLVGMFQGAIQALARSYFAKIIPAEKSGEYFGIYDICGKGASFMGTTLVGIVAQVTGVANAGVAVLAVLFVIGYILFKKAVRA